MKRLISMCAAVALTVTMMPAAPALIAGDMPSADSFQAEAAAKKKFPARYDLRKKGLVTPVKMQDPFSSCWAFGGIAAAEISLLKAKKTTYKKSHLNLSEKHVAWFSLHPITKKEDKAQAGEGLHLFDKDRNAAYEAGGSVLFITSVFASGSGPLTEKAAPYCGKDGLTVYDVLVKNKDKEVKKNKDLLESVFKYAVEAGKYKEGQEKEFLAAYAKNVGFESTGTFEGDAEIMFQQSLDEAKDPYNNTYSPYDDWTVPMTDKDGDPIRSIYVGWTIKDGNMLPEFSKRTKADNWKGINKAGTKAIKSELMKGHGVSMGFHADDSIPGKKGRTYYLNEKTWAHYTYKNEVSNHAVCIVGWNDNYSRKNFTKGHRPSKNGAWLVKNSWGSESPDSVIKTKSGVEIGKSKWGLKDKKGRHTGYFYISYYDKSLNNPESMTFDFSFNNSKGFYCTQYDYMPSAGNVKLTSKKKIKSANVFKGEAKSKLKSVSVKTAVANTKVKFEIYRLKKSAKTPTKGKRVRCFTRKFAYEGFHRTNLKKILKIKKGEKYSIVATQYYKSGKKKKRYVVCAAAMPGKKISKAAEAPAYGRAVVNKGESFILWKSRWKDWKYFRNKKVVKKAIRAVDMDGSVLDNFGIKAYLVK